MYSVLIALLAIVAYHSGIKNPDQGTRVVAGGQVSNMEMQPVPPSAYSYDNQSDDDDSIKEIYE